MFVIYYNIVFEGMYSLFNNVVYFYNKSYKDIYKGKRNIQEILYMETSKLYLNIYGNYIYVNTFPQSQGSSVKTNWSLSSSWVNWPVSNTLVKMNRLFYSGDRA